MKNKVNKIIAVGRKFCKMPLVSAQYYWMRFRARKFICHSYEQYYAWEARRGFPIQRLLFKLEHGHHLNLEYPSSFSEKLVHRKLFSRDPIWPIVTNKISARKWIVDNGFDKYVNLIPSIQVIKDPNDLHLPNGAAPCVIKAAWASGLNIFISSNPANLDDIKATLRLWANSPYAVSKLIWATNQMTRGFLVEKMLQTSSGEPPEDFKFFVFHGKVEIIRIHVSRFGDHRHAFFNRNLERLDLLNCKPAASEYSLPDEIHQMITAAEKIGESFDHVRIDLYLHESKIYFGEITQTTGSGLEPFDPQGFDLVLGNKWDYEPVKKAEGIYR